MNRYSSAITFLYYEHFEQAKTFFKDVLKLNEVMDQGFAVVYKVSEGSFLGCVKKTSASINTSTKGGTCISLCVEDVDQVYKEFQTYKLPYLSDCSIIERIPLKSFFFQDYEGYDFEIQEFLKKEDKDLF